MGEQIAVLYPACSCRSDSCWPRWNQPTRASFWARALLPRRPFRLDGSRSDLFAITPLSQPKMVRGLANAQLVEDTLLLR